MRFRRQPAVGLIAPHHLIYQVEIT